MSDDIVKMKALIEGLDQAMDDLHGKVISISNECAAHDDMTALFEKLNERLDTQSNLSLERQKALEKLMGQLNQRLLDQNKISLKLHTELMEQFHSVEVQARDRYALLANKVNNIMNDLAQVLNNTAFVNEQHGDTEDWAERINHSLDKLWSVVNDASIAMTKKRTPVNLKVSVNDKDETY